MRIPIRPLALLLLALAPSLASALTFPVTSTGDRPDASPGDGACWTNEYVMNGIWPVRECTLRAAIMEANAANGTDRIEFVSWLPTDQGFVRIAPASELPAFTSDIELDGYTAPGYATGDPEAVPVVQIDGSRSSNGRGLRLFSGSNGSLVRGVAVHAFDREGIYIANASGIRVQGNHVGLRDGYLVYGNGLEGIRVANSHVCWIGRVCYNVDPQGCTGKGNVVAGNGTHGIRVSGSHVKVNGNYVGTNRYGTSTVSGWGPTGNGENGILMEGTDFRIGDFGQLTGGGYVQAGNVVAGNGHAGIHITGGPGMVLSNRIGTDVTGSFALPNVLQGVVVANASGQILIGSSLGAATPLGNVISGNGTNGILENASGAERMTILYNHIGTSADATTAIPNGATGVNLHASVAEIDIRSNVIAGNGGAGIGVREGSHFEILGNHIGTNAAGADLGNVGAGISTLLGGVVRDNVIGFNDRGIYSANGSDFTIEENWIGTDASGSDLGNRSEGVYLRGSRNTIASNAIAFNGAAGVRIAGDTSLGNDIADNALHSNAGLGIDLDPWGPTPNDWGDADDGPNDLLNTAVLDAAGTIYDPEAQELHVRFRIDSDPVHVVYPLHVDFYVGDDGEGEEWVGSAVYEAFEAGEVVDRVLGSVSIGGALSEHQLVALVRDGDTHPNTSEFSPAIPLPEPGVAQGLAAALLALRALRGARSRARRA